MSDTNPINPPLVSEVDINTPPANFTASDKQQSLPGEVLEAAARECLTLLESARKRPPGHELLDYLMTLPPDEGDRLAKILTLAQAQGVDPFGIVKRDIESEKNTPPSASEPTTTATSTNDAADEQLDPTPPNNGAFDVSSDLSDRDVSVPQLSPSGLGSPPDLNFSATPDFNTQALQTANDRLIAALQQNTQLATALFERMVALMQEQNRKLAEMDQKISDLGNQLKSLKNP